VTGVTPSGICHPAAFCCSLPPSCMRILRPRIGRVDGAWWGGCHSEGDLDGRSFGRERHSVPIHYSSTPVGIGYGCVVVQHATISAHWSGVSVRLAPDSGERARL